MQPIPASDTGTASLAAAIAPLQTAATPPFHHADSTAISRSLVTLLPFMPTMTIN
jgi:hypothetical protein